MRGISEGTHPYPGSGNAITAKQFRSFEKAVEELGFTVKKNGNLKNADGTLLRGQVDPASRVVTLHSTGATQRTLIDEFAHVWNLAKGRGLHMDDVENSLHIYLGYQARAFGTEGMLILDNIRFHQLELKNLIQSGTTLPSFFDGVPEQSILDFIRFPA